MNTSSPRPDTTVPDTTHQGRLVAVTGGASGIGLATVTAFAAGGAVVIGLDRQVGPDIPGVSWLDCDVTDESSVAAAITRIDQEHTRLDVLINNAGIGGRGTVETATDEDWANIFGVNVFGVARVTRQALPLLRRGSNAAIVNVASLAAVVGTPVRAVYSASKGAVAALTRAMAADLAPERIRVNAVVPGTVHTAVTGRYDDDPVAALQLFKDRQPLGHLIEAEEMARAILFLSSPINHSITGAELRYDGGVSSVVNIGTS